jgi:aminopeptidase N
MALRSVAAAALFVALGFGTAAGGKRPPVDHAEFAKQELFRTWGVRERAALEELKKAEVDQDNYDALTYDLWLDIDVEGEAIAGTMKLEAAALEPGLSILVLDLYDELAVSAVREGGSPALFTHANDLITVSLSGEYAAGDTIRVEVDYGGTPTVVNGYLGQTAFTFGKHGRIPAERSQVVIYTISEPYFARAWWPCKDVPDDKATVGIHVTVPDTLIVASNGVMVGDPGPPLPPPPAGKMRSHWIEKYPIATYLVSLAISNYEVFRDYFHYTPYDSMEVTYFVYPEDLDTARVEFARTVPMLEFFSNAFGRYPFVEEKYGMAEIGWGGAMEHQTCTSLGSRFLARTGGAEWVIAHELAHQWWGDLVTPREWADVWLNEGFATYSEALWFEHTGGGDAYRSWLVGMLPSAGFRGTVYDPDVLFGSTVYRKGAWALHMLRRVMGDARFFDALRAYGSEEGLAYGNATTADFQSICERHYEGSLSWFFDQWIYGEGQPRYAYYIAQNGVGEASAVYLTLRQVQPEGPFTMPLEIRFSLEGGGDTTVTVWNSRRLEDYRFAFGRPVAGVAVDPDDWILKTVEERVLNPVTLEVFPNPFNRTARVGFESGAGGPVELDVFDVTGARVKRLLRDDRTPGYHQIEWSGDNDRGQSVSSGVYFIRIRTGQGSLVRKAVLVK